MTEQPAGAARTLPLSMEQRRRGQRTYFVYNVFNAVSYAVLAEGIVTLTLLRLGGTEVWVGGVNALYYATLPFMVVGYVLIPRLGISGVAALFWALRSLSAAFMIAAPWVGVTFGVTAGLAAMAAGSLGFYLGRAAAMSTTTPIITELTTPRDRAELITSAFGITQYGGLIVTVLVALFLGERAPLHRYQLFFAVGLATGLAAAWALWRLPESGAFRSRAPFRLREELRWLTATRGNRRFLAMMVAIPFTQGITRTFVLVVAKQGYGISDQQALLYWMIYMAGGLLCSYAYGFFMDKLGSRPLLVLTSLVDLAGALLVVVLPGDPWKTLLVVLFLVNGYVNIAFQAAIQHFFITLMDARRQLTQGLITQALGGIAGGISVFAAGAVLVGIKALTAGSSDPLLYFRYFYAGLAVLIVARTAILYQLPAVQSVGVRDALNTLLSPWDWRAITAVKRALAQQSETEETRALEAMQRSRAGIFGAELAEYIRSPSYVVRRRALESLSGVRPNDALVALLLGDLQDNPFTTAALSARWLGRWGVKRAAPALRRALGSPDDALRAAAIGALLDLERREALPAIQRELERSGNPLVIIEGARALAMWGDPRTYGRILDKYRTAMPPQTRSELALSIARLLRLHDRYYRDLGLLARDPPQLYREWAERYGADDPHGLMAAIQNARPDAGALRRTLEGRREVFHAWFSEPTADFLAHAPRLEWEPAFLLTFLLLSPTGAHVRT